MEKILVALLVATTLAGCSQTTRPADEKKTACAYAGLSDEECAKSKYGYSGSTTPSFTSPST